MKRVLLLAICALFALQVNAQEQSLPTIEPCKITSDEMPALRGIKLGMPYTQIKAALPTVIDRGIDETGRRIALARGMAGSSFNDIEKISFDLTDDKLRRFEIFYKQGTGFQSIGEFRDKISPALNISPKSWTISESESGGGLIKSLCYGFEVTVILAKAVGTQQVSITVEDVNNAPNLIMRKHYLKQKAAQETKERTDSFKP